MPAASKHLRRARAHLDALERMKNEVELLSWAAVVAFYVARDLAHAVFDADPTLSPVCRHPKSHTNQDHAEPGTNVVIKRHYSRIASAYIDLYAVSKGVRYEGSTLASESLDDLLAELGEVARWAADELGKANRAVPAWVQDLARSPSAVAPEDGG